jgi:hypothetical protein
VAGPNEPSASGAGEGHIRNNYLLWHSFRSMVENRNLTAKSGFETDTKTLNFLAKRQTPTGKHVLKKFRQ